MGVGFGTNEWSLTPTWAGDAMPAALTCTGSAPMYVLLYCQAVTNISMVWRQMLCLS